MAASCAQGSDTVNLASGVWGTFPSITSTIDTDSYFGGAAGTITFPANGLYASVEWTGLDIASVFSRAGRMLLDGSTDAPCGPVSQHIANWGNISRGQFNAFTAGLKAGQYLELQARQDDPSTEDCPGLFSVVRLPTDTCFSTNQDQSVGLTDDTWEDLPMGTTFVEFGDWQNDGSSITVPDTGEYLILMRVGVTGSPNADSSGVVTEVQVNASAIETTRQTSYTSGHSYAVRSLTAGDVITWRMKPEDFTGPTLVSSGLTVTKIADCVSLYNSTSQHIDNGSFTAYTFDSEYVDTAGYHDNVTNPSRITIPTGKGGKYLMMAKSDLGSVRDTQSAFYVNGSATVIWYVINWDYTTYVIAVLDLADGDYVEFLGETDSGGGDTATNQEFAAVYLDPFTYTDLPLSSIPRCPWLSYWGWIAKILRYV